MTLRDFPLRLARCGVPPEVIPGLAEGGAFRAFFNNPSDAAILSYFEAAAQNEPAPGPYFDPGYYRAQNPDWREGGSALGHFLLRLLADDPRPAHPLFDADDYARRYPDLRAANSATLLHFAQHGDAEARQPGPEFDPAFYAARYLSLTQPRPFAHYIQEGRAQGHSPRPRPQPPGATATRIAAQLAQGARPVLLIGHDARKAGAQIRLLALARAFRAAGWTPVIVLEGGGPLVPDFAQVGPVTVLCEGWEIAELAKLAPDVPALALTVETAPLLAQICAGRRSFLMVLEMPAYWRARGLTPALEQVARAGAQMIFGFPVIAEGFAADMPALSVPSHVILPALLPPEETCGDYLRHARRRRRAVGGPVIIGAGFADARKGFDWFLAVAQQFWADHPAARFIWLGELSAWARDLADAALAQGLPLELPGFVADAGARYAAADLFLLTTRQDPGPTVLADAGLRGRPYVAFDTDIGMRDLLGGYPDLGRFVPPGDIPAAARAIAAELTSDTRAKRRRRRDEITAKAGFAPYAARIIALLAGD